jgi:hypothetical protein
VVDRTTPAGLRKPRWALWAGLAALVLVLVLVGGIAVWKGQGSVDRPVTPTSDGTNASKDAGDVVVVPTPAVEVPRDLIDPAVAPAPPIPESTIDLVHLTFVEVPEGATIRVGEDVIEGQAADVPRSREPIRVSVALDGYRDYTTRVVPSEDQRADTTTWVSSSACQARWTAIPTWTRTMTAMPRLTSTRTAIPTPTSMETLRATVCSAGDDDMDECCIGGACSGGRMQL